MKKRINNTKKKDIKEIIIFFIVVVFVIFITSTLVLIDRRYFFVEKGVKSITNSINAFVIKKVYKNPTPSYDKILKHKLNIKEKENNDLKKLLELKEKNETYIPSEITNHNMILWYNKVEINSKNKNIKKNLAVINSDGLIGFVSKTSKNVCEVNLITSIDENNMLSVSIKTNDKDINGVLKSFDKKKGLFKVVDVIEKNEIKKGDKVILSGYDKTSYNGLLVGEVYKEEVSDYGLTKTVWVKSNVDFNNLMYVIVVGEV